MAPKIIELKQAPVVLVELNKGDISYYNIDSYVRKGLEESGYIYHGFLSDLTEEQFAECVERIDQEYTFGYRDYTGFIDDLSKARHSFSSLLESEGVYTENPYDYMLQSTEENFDNCKCDKTELQIVREKYGQAQQRTIDPKRTVVLLKK